MVQLARAHRVSEPALDLRNWPSALRRKRGVALVVFLVIFAAGVLVSYLPSERFQAKATLLALPVPSTARPSAVQVVRFMIPSIARRAESPSFTDLALDSASFPYGRGTVRITATDDPNTGVVTITAEGAERDAVAPAANLIAGALLKSRIGEGFMTLTLIDSAVAPSGPASPRRSADLLMAGALGAVLAALAASLAESWSPQLDRADETRTRFGTAVVGEIPAVRRSVARRSLRKPAEMFAAAGPSAVTEAFYALRTNVEVLLSGRHIEALIVTSLEPGEGKSTVAAGLGWLLASGGRRVVLVDGNLRNPTLHCMFDQPFATGLADAGLPSSQVAGSEEVPILPLARRTQLSNLRLVHAGLPQRHPAEMVRVGLPKILDVLADAEPLAIIDSPALLGMSDAATAAAICRFALLVVDVRARRSADIEHALDELRSKETEVVGIVINRVRRRRARRRKDLSYAASL